MQNGTAALGLDNKSWQTSFYVLSFVQVPDFAFLKGPHVLSFFYFDFTFIILFHTLFNPLVPELRNHNLNGCHY